MRRFLSQPPTRSRVLAVVKTSFYTRVCARGTELGRIRQKERDPGVS